MSHVIDFKVRLLMLLSLLLVVLGMAFATAPQAHAWAILCDQGPGLQDCYLISVDCDYYDDWGDMDCYQPMVAPPSGSTSLSPSAPAR